MKDKTSPFKQRFNNNVIIYAFKRNVANVPRLERVCVCMSACVCVCVCVLACVCVCASEAAGGLGSDAGRSVTTSDGSLRIGWQVR